MKKILICFLCISGGLVKVSAQETTVDQWKYQPNFFLGLDVLNGVVSMFSDRQLYQGFVASQISRNIYGVADVGFEKNVYEKGGYDANASGIFFKVGAQYMLSKDRENPHNGFYAGGKLAASFYEQEYKAIPIRGYGGNAAAMSFPASRQISGWIEGSVGGRVQLFQTPLYIDVNAQPKYMIYSKKQEDIVPMIVPGFGRSSNKFGVGVSWSIVYKF